MKGKYKPREGAPSARGLTKVGYRDYRSKDERMRHVISFYHLPFSLEKAKGLFEAVARPWKKVI